MTLHMKSNCERCGRDLLPAGPAYICSYECTWCRECASGFEFRCPNCGGELVARPRRTPDVPETRPGGEYT